MWQGEVTAIFIAPDAGAAMESTAEAHAIPGQGLEGDRYATARGTYSNKPGVDRQLTLIEEEELAAIERDYGHRLEPAESRRNVITRGVPLNHLVGRTFRVGEVTLRGVRLCEPCGYLEQVTGKPVRQPLLHRGGLRAEILTEGWIQVGDTLREAEPVTPAADGEPLHPSP